MAVTCAAELCPTGLRLSGDAIADFGQRCKSLRAVDHAFDGRQLAPLAHRPTLLVVTTVAMDKEATLEVEIGRDAARLAVRVRASCPEPAVAEEGGACAIQCTMPVVSMFIVVTTT